jgi:TLD
MKELLDDEEDPRCMSRRTSVRGLKIGGNCTNDYEETVPINKPQIESLRDAVGDFGIALFAPLLDFDKEDHRGGREIFKSTQETVTSSSCTATTTQAESESDQYQLEDDDDLDGPHDDEDVNNDDDDREYAVDTVQIVPESLAQINACPPILSEQNIQYLQTYLPFSIRDYIWERRFVIGLHGDSFCTLLQKCEGYKNSMVVIRTTCGLILGGYASEEWRVCSASGSNSSIGATNHKSKYRSMRHSYYGTGQSYIFGSSTLHGSEHRNETTLCVYPWTGHNDYCQICDVDRSILCMGGVGEFGWIVSDNFTVGRTGPCATYNNPPLIENTTFRIADFEIYTLISPIAQFLQEHLKL